jgi:hypothetical protein
MAIKKKTIKKPNNTGFGYIINADGTVRFGFNNKPQGVMFIEFHNHNTESTVGLIRSMEDAYIKYFYTLKTGRMTEAIKGGRKTNFVYDINRATGFCKYGWNNRCFGNIIIPCPTVNIEGVIIMMRDIEKAYSKYYNAMQGRK